MTFGIEGKKILLVGGAGGIGSVIARDAAALGAEVMVWDIRDDHQLPREVGYARVRADSEEEVAAGFDSLAASGNLPSVLINAAGVFTHLKPVEALDKESFFNVVTTNLGTVFVTSREALRRCVPGLSIVTISSSLAKRPIPMASAYCTSKAAIDGLTRSIALEYADKQVRANCVSPGPVKGEMLSHGLSEISEFLDCTSDDVLEMIHSVIPQKRLFSPEEVSRLALFLSGDNSQGITGQTFDVSGGFFM